MNLLTQQFLTKNAAVKGISAAAFSTFLVCGHLYCGKIFKFSSK
jgi:hypothetical protein